MRVILSSRSAGSVLRTALYSIAALALVGTAAYLAWNTRPTDDRARVEVAAKLQLLSELGARWDIAILTAKTDPQQVVQAEISLAPSIGRTFADLQQLATAVRSTALDENLPGIATALAERTGLGRQLAEATTRLVQALDRALDVTARAASSLSAQADVGLRERAQVAARAMDLTNAELLAYWGDSGQSRRARVDAALAALNALDGLDGLPAALAAREAQRSDVQTVLDEKPALEALLARFALSPAGPRLSALTSRFAAEVQSGIERQQLFRTYLLFYSAALLVLLGWIASRLVASYRVIGEINADLQAANENLEQKVVQRTAELSEALTHLKESETQLIQSEKMSSLGQMVAGIAHEINTPIAYVKNSLGSVDTRLDAMNRLAGECEKLLAMLDAGNTPDDALELQVGNLAAAANALGGTRAVAQLGALVKDGLYGVDQIGQIVTHLRDFSRLDRGDLQRFDLHQCIDSTLLLARHLLKAIRVEKKFGTDGTLVGSPSQINQVLLNLITNAAQAMGTEGGVITLATHGNREHLLLDVTDSGPGIAPEVLPKIFDPFFTTKPVGQGTGLGLSITYKIIAQHGGRIEARSLPGRGTTFRIRLPRAGSAGSTAAPAAAPS